jgi:hypothetical protein
MRSGLVSTEHNKNNAIFMLYHIWAPVPLTWKRGNLPAVF